MNESVTLFQRSLNDFKEVHELVQMVLSEKVKEKERIDWYEPKMSTFENFLKDVGKWKTSQTDPQSLVEPKDSISNVSKSSRVSKGSKSGSTTSAASARLKVATEKAALLARAAALKRKHALEMEKAQLNSRLELMELEVSLAESDAKLKVLENFESEKEQHLPTSEPQEQHEDGMNEYLEITRKKQM